MNLLHVSNLSIGYKKPIKENLNFVLNEGDVLLIKGLNGSGKTTLLKTILGEISPINGSVKIQKQFTYLPQLTNQFSHTSLNLQEILNCSNVHPDILNLFNKKLLHTPWRLASGGQKQRTLIASRIHQNPQILILDEPFNHLDSQAIDEVNTFLLYMLEKKFILGMIIVSHIPLNLPDLKVKEILL